MPLRCLMLIWLIGLGSPGLAQYRVAIFDFDDRSSEAMPQAVVVENEIRKLDEKVRIVQFSAMGDVRRAMVLADQIDSSHFDLAIVISSDALRVAKFRLNKTPFLFTNVNNPLFLGYSSLETPGQHSSGVTYYVAIEKQLNFFRKIVPHIQKIGFIFDDDAVSRRPEFKESRAYCLYHNLGFFAKLIHSADEVGLAARELLGAGVDAIVLTSSGLVYDHTPAVVAETNAEKIPVFSYNRKAVQFGAIASLASDYTAMNTQLLPAMIRRVMKEGANPGNLPVQSIKNPASTINETAAKALGIVIPPEILKSAGTVY